MRTRTAKTLAKRIDLNYFKRPHALRRLRLLLSLAVPAVGLLWLGGMAAAGSRAPYSSGPVSASHAFAENKCEVCHQRDESFRAHVGDKACLTCHDGPLHTAKHPLPLPTPDCASCHREHQGRVALAATVAEPMCVDCHGDAKTTSGDPAKRVSGFPAGHTEFEVLREARRDPATIRFNHQVHANENLRGPDGPEKLECASCHQPRLAPTRQAPKRVENLMTAVTYNQQCARCHPLFFDERVEAAVPHGDPKAVRPFIEKTLRDVVARNPKVIFERDRPGRPLPLNFPREPEPVARNAQEWVAKRTARSQAIVDRTCIYCHGTTTPAAITWTTWMPKAGFDHGPHLMVECASCHNAEKSRATSDVLMPSIATCATCHAPGKGAPAQCITCHGYHDWSKAQPVKPHFKLTDFQ